MFLLRDPDVTTEDCTCVMCAAGDFGYDALPVSFRQGFEREQRLRRRLRRRGEVTESDLSDSSSTC